MSYQPPLFPGLVVPVHQSDLIAERTIPGGLVASKADVTAAEEARAFASAFNPSVASNLDWVTRLLQVDFKSPLEAGDTLRSSAQVVGVGSKSLTLEVEVLNDNSFVDGKPTVVAQAKAVFVAVSPSGSAEHQLSADVLTASGARCRVTPLIRLDGQTDLGNCSVSKGICDEERTHSNLMFPAVLNPHSSVFGGYIADMVDQAAMVHSKRLLRKCGKQASFEKHGATFVSRAMEVNYLAPIHVGDVVEIRTAPIRYSTSTVSFSFKISAGKGRTRKLTPVGSGEVVLISWTPSTSLKFPHQLFTS